MEISILNCPRCKELHKYDVNSSDLESKNTINLACKNISRFLRLTKFTFDTRSNLIKHVPSYEEDFKKSMQSVYGAADLDKKLERWANISKTQIWIVDEYNEVIDEIVSSYIAGYYYCATVSACCLTERILNRLVIKLKNYHKESDFYKKIYNWEEKIQNWDLLTKILEDWSVLDEFQITLCKKLHQLRTNTVHYVPGGNFVKSAEESITAILSLIESLFGVFCRKDIFWIFNIPGEIWVKENVQDLPFVKEFILPACNECASVYQVQDGVYIENEAPIGHITEEEFIRVRSERKDSSENVQPLPLIQIEVEGKQIFVRVI